MVTHLGRCGACAGIVAAEVIGVGRIQDSALYEGTRQPAAGLRSGAELKRPCAAAVEASATAVGAAVRHRRSLRRQPGGEAREVGDMSSPQLFAQIRRAALGR